MPALNSRIVNNEIQVLQWLHVAAIVELNREEIKKGCFINNPGDGNNSKRKNDPGIPGITK